MRIVGVLLRIFAYLFHLPLIVFLLGISGLNLISGAHALRLDMLPWEGRELTYWLFLGSLAGLLSLALAVLGKLRILFAAWCVAVLVILFRGYFLGPYVFDDADHFLQAVYLTVGALLAAVGSLAPRRKR